MEPAALPRFVEDIRVIEPADGRRLPIDRLPDGRTTLVFRDLDGDGRGDLVVAGPRTRAFYKEAPPLVRAVIVRLRPGWSAPLLGVPVRELTDRATRLDDVWGAPARDLCTALLAARDTSGVLGRLWPALTRRMHDASESASARLARRAARLLDDGEVRVERVADRLGVTSRHLRRTFADHIGVCPKQFARCARLQRALRLTRESADWGRIAVDAGYYDHAHLISDFRELVGLTPRAFVRRAQQQSARA